METHYGNHHAPYPHLRSHCDTLDRLALHNAIPEAGFMAEDSLVPAHRMSSLADNAAHIDLTRMARAQYAWCQCFAAFIPDGLGEQGSLHVFNTVHSYFKEQLAQHAGLIEQVMDARDIRRIVDEGVVLPCSRSRERSF
ncbi:MAG: hypothetical protein ACLT98_09525 [Eggerthellaceae bacterium]